MTPAAAPRLLYVVTHPMTARHLLRGQPSFMRAAGFEVAVACPEGSNRRSLSFHTHIRPGYLNMGSTYDIGTEGGDLVIRIRPPGADRESLQRLLDFLELEAVRKRSAMEAGQAEALAREVKGGAWDRVRHLFGRGEERV